MGQNKLELFTIIIKRCHELFVDPVTSQSPVYNKNIALLFHR